MPSPSSNSIFDLVLGLPLHPLVVHAVVVLLPLAALAVIVLFAVPRWRRPFALPTLGLLLVVLVTSFVARFSGEELEERVGDPGRHADWGGLLPFAAGALVVLAGVWLVLAGIQQKSSTVTTVLGVLSVVASVVALGLTVVTGHSGSQAVWEGRVASDPVPAAAPPSPTPSGASGTAGAGVTTGSTSPATITMAEVESNDSQASCYAVVHGSVYDLTSWIENHPGGAERILGLCGTDATAAFTDQHADSTAANTRLDSFLLGELAE